ncbi:hypothetical protein EHQ75_11225 [Leptospira levettii]|nr:hypothetical protein EHQ75_11225 [Leptospira levettii]
MKFLKQLWTKILNIGVTNELKEKDAKFIRLTNALSIIVGVWLFSIIPSLLPYYPSSQYIIFNSIFFPVLWLFVLYFNYKGWYTFAKLFFLYTAMLCVVFNSLQAGRESDNHLFLLLISIMAFYTFPPKQLRYITRVSISALILFISVEFYLTNKGPIIQAPPEFFQLGRLITLVALCALDMLSSIENGITQDSKPFKIRIGIHTGPVVAGVIGKSKFIYDLWGDSVNTASRMESHGTEGKIHVSKEVYQKLKSNFTFETKREIQVKGKGIMETYFLIKKN